PRLLPGPYVSAGKVGRKHLLDRLGDLAASGRGRPGARGEPPAHMARAEYTNALELDWPPGREFGPVHGQHGTDLDGPNLAFQGAGDAVGLVQRGGDQLVAGGAADAQVVTARVVPSRTGADLAVHVEHLAVW